MEEMLRGAAVVGQSGGPTAAINATLAGVIKGCFESSDAVTKLYGMKNGIEGFLGERMCDLGSIFSDEKGDVDRLRRLLSVHAEKSSRILRLNQSFTKSSSRCSKNTISDISSTSAETTQWIPLRS